MKYKILKELINAWIVREQQLYDAVRMDLETSVCETCEHQGAINAYQTVLKDIESLEKRI